MCVLWNKPPWSMSQGRRTIRMLGMRSAFGNRRERHGHKICSPWIWYTRVRPCFRLFWPPKGVGAEPHAQGHSLTLSATSSATPVTDGPFPEQTSKDEFEVSPSVKGFFFFKFPVIPWARAVSPRTAGWTMSATGHNADRIIVTLSFSLRRGYESGLQVDEAKLGCGTLRSNNRTCIPFYCRVRECTFSTILYGNAIFLKLDQHIRTGSYNNTDRGPEGSRYPGRHEDGSLFANATVSLMMEPWPMVNGRLARVHSGDLIWKIQVKRPNCLIRLISITEIYTANPCKICQIIGAINSRYGVNIWLEIPIKSERFTICRRLYMLIISWTKIHYSCANTVIDSGLGIYWWHRHQLLGDVVYFSGGVPIDLGWCVPIDACVGFDTRHWFAS